MFICSPQSTDPEIQSKYKYKYKYKYKNNYKSWRCRLILEKKFQVIDTSGSMIALLVPQKSAFLQYKYKYIYKYKYKSHSCYTEKFKIFILATGCIKFSAIPLVLVYY